MKIAIREAIPSPADIAAGLDLRTVHPALVDAELAERQRAEDVADAQAALVTASMAAESLAREVQAGRAPAVDLERATAHRHALALAIGAARTRLAEAEASRAHGVEVAREKVRAEARRRNDELERIASTLAPALEMLADAELALDAAVGRVLGPTTPRLPAVVWPPCVRDR